MTINPDTVNEEKFIVRKYGYISFEKYKEVCSLEKSIVELSYEELLIRKIRYLLLRRMIKYVNFKDEIVFDSFYEKLIKDSKKQWEIINGSMDGYGEWETEEELEKVRKISERITFSAEDSEYILKYKK